MGQGHIEEVKEPTPIDYLGGLQIRSIAAGYWHSLAVTGNASFKLVTLLWNATAELSFPLFELRMSYPNAIWTSIKLFISIRNYPLNNFD